MTTTVTWGKDRLERMTIRKLICLCCYRFMHACTLNHSVMSSSLQPHGLKHTRIPCPWNVPGKNTGVGCHFLLQGIFLTQGSNLHLWHRQVDSLPLSCLESLYCFITYLIIFVQSVSLVTQFLKYKVKRIFFKG